MYQVKTGATYQGDVGGYEDANTICNVALPGSHVCKTSEILNSISCEHPNIVNEAGDAWIANGPPGYIAPANDCRGWTSSGGDIGTYWQFDDPGDPDDDGIGWATYCNNDLPFACCK